MNVLLAKLAPFRDWAYAALLVALVVFYNVHVHDLIANAKQAQATAVQKASESAKASAALEIARNKADYETRLAATRSAYSAIADANNAAHDADVKRLRALADGYLNANRALQSAAGASGKPDSTARPGSDSGVGDLPEGFRVSLGLADALRFDDNLLNECRADRGALTGK